MIRLRFELGVSAEHRREGSHLEPAYIEFRLIRVGGIDSKTADIGAHIPETGESGAEHQVDLRLEATPTSRHVGGPGEDAISLEAGSTAAHHQ